MPATSDDLFALFKEMGIAYQTVKHPPMFTVEDGREWHDKILGLHCKNLFLKDKKGQIWLACLPGDKRADIGRLEKQLGSGRRLSFAKPELLLEVLGLTPGSVTPFGLLNDKERRVAVILDSDMMAADLIHFHPLHNAESTTIASADLLRFIKSLGYEPLILDCGAAVAAA